MTTTITVPVRHVIAVSRLGLHMEKAARTCGCIPSSVARRKDGHPRFEAVVRLMASRDLGGDLPPTPEALALFWSGVKRSFTPNQIRAILRLPPTPEPYVMPQQPTARRSQNPAHSYQQAEVHYLTACRRLGVDPEKVRASRHDRSPEATAVREQVIVEMRGFPVDGTDRIPSVIAVSVAMGLERSGVYRHLRRMNGWREPEQSCESSRIVAVDGGGAAAVG